MASEEQTEPAWCIVCCETNPKILPKTSKHLVGYSHIVGVMLSTLDYHHNFTCDLSRLWVCNICYRKVKKAMKTFKENSLENFILCLPDTPREELSETHLPCRDTSALIPLINELGSFFVNKDIWRINKRFATFNFVCQLDGGGTPDIILTPTGIINHK